MSRAKIVLNRSGIREMLRSVEVKNAIKEQADQIADRCGEGYEAGSTIGRQRALAHVRAATPEAVRDNYDNNTILKAVK